MKTTVLSSTTLSSQSCNQWSVTELCRYLFIPYIDVHVLGGDGVGDVFDVIVSAVVKDVLILFPENMGGGNEQLSVTIIFIIINMVLL